jgi:LPS-assembly protein
MNWSRQGAAWFVTAQAGIHLRHYDLNQGPNGANVQDYAIPITTLDAGLFFERDTAFFGRNFIQTLEPRAYFAYIPYRNQANAPNFDSAVDDFNFAQLFSPNRYLGNDRIGDASQISLALTSRLLDPGSGAERLRLAIGQRYYFESQQVTLNETPRTSNSSDILVGAEGRLNETWAFVGLWQRDVNPRSTGVLNGAVRYTPAPGKVLSAIYRFTAQPDDPSTGTQALKQFDIAAQWPLTDNVTFLGRWNYQLVKPQKTLEAIGGIEYNADCWVLRFVVQRLQTTSAAATSSVYVQFEFNGLARVGTSPLDLLRRSIPGYLRTNDTTVAPRGRGSDYFPEF